MHLSWELAGEGAGVYKYVVYAAKLAWAVLCRCSLPPTCIRLLFLLVGRSGRKAAWSWSCHPTHLPSCTFPHCLAKCVVPVMHPHDPLASPHYLLPRPVQKGKEEGRKSC